MLENVSRKLRVRIACLSLVVGFLVPWIAVAEAGGPGALSQTIRQMFGGTVAASGASDGQALVYTAATRTWAGGSVSANVQTLLDGISSTRGSVLYRGASGWAALAPGTSTHVLTSNGAGADPSYQAAGGSLSGISNATAGQLDFTSVLGGTNHIVGPAERFRIACETNNGGNGYQIDLFAGSGGTGTGSGGWVSATPGDAGSTATNKSGGAFQATGARSYGTNITAYDHYMIGGKGTGTGESGGTLFQSSDVGTSGTTVHGSQTDRVRIGRNLNTMSNCFLIMAEHTDDPGTADLSANAAISIYSKNNKLVIAYNNASTVTYVTLPLDGSSTTWTHSTSAP